MRHTISALAIFLAIALASTTSARAQETDVSAMIASQGLSATVDALASLEAPSPNQRFALGGVRFLGAVEHALQARYRYGMTGRTLDLPVLRLPIADNPEAEPFRPEAVEEIFVGIIDDMAASRAPLSEITAGDDVALLIRLEDLWFDVNSNAVRDDGEALSQIGAGILFPRRFGAAGETTLPTVQFDTADASWLEAYTHFIAGTAELVVAHHPAEPIARVLGSKERFDDLIGDAPPVDGFDYLFSTEVDLAAMVYFALRQQPDPDHTRAARQHFLSMIRLNREFWRRVEDEEDNFAEWVPNGRQTSALGIDMPPETGARWQDVLADAEALLTGEKLIPHWRFGSQAGINLARLLDDPIPIEPVAWLQGVGLVDYAERGERVSPVNWRQFERLVRGNSLLFVFFLN